MEKRFIGIKELSEYLGVNMNTLRYWVWLKQVPYHKLGGLVRFDLREIELWTQDNKVGTINRY